MNTQPVLIRETSSPTELAKLAVDAVTRGDVDPLVAYENISRMEKAIELFKKSEEVRDITLRELAKYGHGKTSSDCTKCVMRSWPTSRRRRRYCGRCRPPA